MPTDYFNLWNLIVTNSSKLWRKNGSIISIFKLIIKKKICLHVKAYIEVDQPPYSHTF